MRVFIFIICLLFSFSANAQKVCGVHNVVADKLKKVFKEEPVGQGLDSNGGLVEVYVSESGTWTITITQADGISCLVGTGESWIIIAPEIDGQGT